MAGMSSAGTRRRPETIYDRVERARASREAVLRSRETVAAVSVPDETDEPKVGAERSGLIVGAGFVAAVGLAILALFDPFTPRPGPGVAAVLPITLDAAGSEERPAAILSAALASSGPLRAVAMPAEPASEAAPVVASPTRPAVFQVATAPGDALAVEAAPEKIGAGEERVTAVRGDPLRLWPARRDILPSRPPRSRTVAAATLPAPPPQPLGPAGPDLQLALERGVASLTDLVLISAPPQGRVWRKPGGLALPLRPLAAALGVEMAEPAEDRGVPKAPQSGAKLRVALPAPLAPPPRGGMAPVVAGPPERLTIFDGRLILHVPTGAAEDAAGVAEAWLADAGFAVETVVPVDLPIGTSHVRVFHDADRPAARRIAALIGGEVRDFTGFRPAPRKGHLEAWLAGRSGADVPRESVLRSRPSASRAAPVLPPAPRIIIVERPRSPTRLERMLRWKLSLWGE